MKLQTNFLLACILMTGQLIHGQTTNILTEGRVLFLPFTGNVADSSGNGYSITNTGATLAPDRFGNENSAYYFDGSDQMTISSSQNLPNIDSSGYTISFWVKQNLSASDDGTILSYGSYGAGGYAFGYKADTYYSTKVNTTTGNTYTLIRIGEYDRILEENWNMLTLTYSDGIMKSYVNGAFVEENAVEGFASSGYDFVIGNSTTCWIDDITIFSRSLNNIEIAQLSGLSGAVRAVDLNSYLLTDFERGDLHPAQYTSSWHVYGHVGDDLSYCKVLENPIKSGSNTSDYCMASITFPTKCSGNLASEETPSRKQEYTIYTDDGEMGDHHHIYQWKVLMYDSTIIEIDSLMWFTNNQVAGNFQLYDGRCYSLAGEEGGISYGGGIFNDNEKETSSEYVLNPEERLDWYWRYRVLPDTARVRYKYEIGKWTSWTYDIFWTKSDTGYWRLYKDGELISYKDNAVTLPECAPENSELYLAHKIGVYTRWNDYIDNVIDSLNVYYDDIEMYVDPEKDGITIQDINPEAYTSLKKYLRIHGICDTLNWEYDSKITDASTYGGSDGEINLSAFAEYSSIDSYLWSTGDTTEDISGLRSGTYSVTITDTIGCEIETSFTVGQAFYDAPFIDTIYSSSDDGNVITNVIDNDLNTHWASAGWGTNIVCVLDELMYVDSVGIYFTYVSGREYSFKLSYSSDSINWTNFEQDVSSMIPADYEYFDIGAICKYVRYTGYGNNVNLYSNIKEFRVFANVDVTYCDTVNFSASAKVTATYLNDGAIDQTVISPQSVTHSWSNGASTEDLSGLTAGTYTDRITMIDSSCVLVKKYTIDLLDPCDTTSIKIVGVVISDTILKGVGAIDIDVSGGYGPYTYSWNNGKNKEDISGLEAGSYIVTVTDQNSCFSSETFIVKNLLLDGSDPCDTTSLIISGTTQNESYIKADGAIDISVSGGQPPYEYSWDNGETTEDISELSTGAYSVVVMDANSCFSVMAFSIKYDEPCESVDINFIPDEDLSSFTDYGENDGVIILKSVEGGLAPYKFLWNDSSTSINRFDLSSGYYSVQLTDANGCTSIDTFYIQSYIEEEEGIPKTSVDKLNTEMLVNIYPNPTNGVFNIKLENNNTGTRIEVFSATGSMIYSEEMDTNSEIEIDLSRLNDGVYLVFIINSAVAESYKLIKH